MLAAAAVAQHEDWREALADALNKIAPFRDAGAKTDLALLFASQAYAPEFPELVTRTRAATGARVLVGCSGQGVIGPAREIEGAPALTLLVLSLPGARLTPLHITQRDLEQLEPPESCRRYSGVGADDVNAWLLLADPFTLDIEGLMATLSGAYPDAPLVGGMASGDTTARRTHLFLNGDVYESGAVALALGGPFGLRTVVSQGCTPIGQPWTITGARGQIIETIAGRPAIEVLTQTMRELPPGLQERARSNLLVGLAMDEYREEFGRGDFLIRNLLGADRESGTLTVGALPRAGQTVQFQLRDAEAADEDLRLLLERERLVLGDTRPVAGVLWSCNGRGAGLFGSPDHDARTVAAVLGPVPLAGFFCNGEIGPVGGRSFLHGFTASMLLFTPADRTPTPPPGPNEACLPSRRVPSALRSRKPNEMASAGSRRRLTPDAQHELVSVLTDAAFERAPRR
jgi:small ligand-binding sensory domain FIST